MREIQEVGWLYQPIEINLEVVPLLISNSKWYND